MCKSTYKASWNDINKYLFMHGNLPSFEEGNGNTHILGETVLQITMPQTNNIEKSITFNVAAYRTNDTESIISGSWYLVDELPNDDPSTIMVQSVFDRRMTNTIFADVYNCERESLCKKYYLHNSYNGKKIKITVITSINDGLTITIKT
jgi:hypothetical protein